MADGETKKRRYKNRAPTGSPMGFTLFIAYFGALVYFIQHSHGFWGFLFSFVQAAIWPAYVLHAVLKLLNI
jgi:hypothetical protein